MNLAEMLVLGGTTLIALYLLIGIGFLITGYAKKHVRNLGREPDTVELVVATVLWPKMLLDPNIDDDPAPKRPARW